MFSTEVVKALEAPLNAKFVAERSQSGRKLSYLEGWHVIAEANRIFGFDAWTRETVECRCVAEHKRTIGREPNQKQGWGVSYVAKVRVTVNGIPREGTGAGHGIDVDLGLAHESAIKEAETDAMKRALMTFGNPFGLALYDKTQSAVATDEQIAQREAEQQWQGPLNKTALKKAIRELGTLVRNAESVMELDEHVLEAKPIIDQLAVDLPLWWEGGEGIEKGFAQLINEKRAELSAIEADEPEEQGSIATEVEQSPELKELRKAMWRCDTTPMLLRWRKGNDKAITALVKKEHAILGREYHELTESLALKERVAA